MSVWRQPLVKSEPLLIFLVLSTLGVHTAMAGEEERERGREEKGRKELGCVCTEAQGFAWPSF